MACDGLGGQEGNCVVGMQALLAGEEATTRVLEVVEAEQGRRIMFAQGLGLAKGCVSVGVVCKARRMLSGKLCGGRRRCSPSSLIRIIRTSSELPNGLEGFHKQFQEGIAVL